MMPALRTMSAALKTPASPVASSVAPAIASPVTTISTVAPIASIAPSVVPSTRPPVIPAASPALWPLEAGTRVAADAGRITPHKFLARCARTARAARFAGKEHDVVLDARFAGGALCRNGFVLPFPGALPTFFAIESRLRRLDHFLMFFLLLTIFALFALVLFLFGFFFAALRLLPLGFLGKVFLGQMVLGVMCVFVSFLVKILVLFLVGLFAFFIKDRAAYVRIRFGPRLGLFMLGFNQPRRERGEFFLAKAGGFAVMRLVVRFLVMFLVVLFRACSLLLGGFGGSMSLFLPCFTPSGRFAFRFGVR